MGGFSPLLSPCLNSVTGFFYVSCGSWPAGARRPNQDYPGGDPGSTPALEKRGSFLPVLFPWKILMAVFCGASGQKDEAASAFMAREEWVVAFPPGATETVKGVPFLLSCQDPIVKP